MIRIIAKEKKMAKEVVSEEEVKRLVLCTLGRPEDMDGEVTGHEAGDRGRTDVVWFKEFYFCHVGS